jgi:hypothetical protein
MRAVAVTAIVFALVAITGASAQQPSPAPAPAAPTAPTAADAPAPPAPARPARPAQAPRPVTRVPAPGTAPAPAPAAPAPFVRVEPTDPGQLVNIQIDIRIAEEASGQPPVNKTVTLTVADRQSGSSRAVDRAGEGVGILNVDVYPVVQKNGRILTRIGLEYQNMKEQPSVQMRAQPLLESGKGLRVSRSASPTGDRTVTVDVTATLLK